MWHSTHKWFCCCHINILLVFPSFPLKIEWSTLDSRYLHEKRYRALESTQQRATRKWDREKEIWRLKTEPYERVLFLVNAPNKLQFHAFKSKWIELQQQERKETKPKKKEICFEPKVTRIFIVFLSMKLDIVNYGLKHGARKRMCAVSRANVNSHTKRAAFWACHKYETHYPTKDKNGCDSIYCDCCLFALKCCERVCLFNRKSRAREVKQKKTFIWNQDNNFIQKKLSTIFGTSVWIS